MIGKKGQAFTLTWKMLFWLVISIVLVITAFLIISFFSRFVNSSLTTPTDTYIQVYTQRFIGSPSCFAYQDPLTGRVMPGVIDKSRFNDKVLQHCYSTIPENIQFQLELQDLERATGYPPVYAKTETFHGLKETFTPTFVWIRQSDGTLHKGKLLVSTGQ